MEFKSNTLPLQLLEYWEERFLETSPLSVVCGGIPTGYLWHPSVLE